MGFDGKTREEGMFSRIPGLFGTHIINFPLRSVKSAGENPAGETAGCSGRGRAACKAGKLLKNNL